MEEDTRVQRTLRNIWIYNIKSAIFNFASAWKDQKLTTLSNSLKKIMLDEDPDLDFAGFEPNDFQQLLCVLEREMSESKMLKTGWKKEIPTLVTKSFLRRKLWNRFWLVTNQERVAAVTLWTRWWWGKKSIKCEIVLTLSYNMLMRQMTVTFKVLMNTSTH